MGLEQLARLTRSLALARSAGGALALLSLASGLRAGSLTFGELGQYQGSRPGASAWGDAGPVNRLLIAAGSRADLCGLKVEAVHLAWTGGYSHLHRPVPLYPHTGPARGSGFFNYVLTAAPVGDVVAQEGHFALVRLSRPRCIADPHFSWRLP